MFGSLRGRLWLSYALIIVTALGVVAVFLFIYVYRNPLFYRQRLEQLRAVETVLLSGEDSASQTFPLAVENAARTFGVRVVVYSRDKQVLTDTAGDGPALAFPQRNLLNRNPRLARDAGGQAWLYTLRQSRDGSWVLVAAPRPRLSFLNLFADELLPLFAPGACVALLLSLLAAYLLSRWIADPLQKVVVAARAVPSEPVRPAAVGGPREIQELTRAFNAMVSRVSASQKSQRELIADVSHELKTPLTSIQGFAQAILDETADTPAARRQAAEVIHGESARMHRLVLELLDLARLEAGTAGLTIAPLNLISILQATIEKFTLQAHQASVRVSLEASEDMHMVLGDGDRLAQVFTNLVDNALKFSPPGGSVTLRAETRNGLLYGTVSDDGPGISSEDQAHIFDRFFKTDRSRGGGETHSAGLGLAIAREIVQAHGGKISVRSQPGHGTTLIVQLPIA